MTKPDEKVPGEEKPKSRLELLEETLLSMVDIVEDQAKRIAALEKTSVKKSAGLFGGKRERTAIKDTTTSKIYPSKASVGKALYAEIEGGDPGDHFIWYKLMAKFPERFVDASPEEAQASWKAEDDKRAKEVEEENKKLAAEEAAKKAKESK